MATKDSVQAFNNLSQTKNLERWNYKMQKIIVKEEIV
jgi:hypothetical protein